MVSNPFPAYFKNLQKNSSVASSLPFPLNSNKNHQKEAVKNFHIMINVNLNLVEALK